MKCLNVYAKKENINLTINFVDDYISKLPCSNRKHFCIVVDEIFSNIVKYAYDNDQGKCQIICDYDVSSKTVILKFIDYGIEYDPLKQIDPNTLLSVEDRMEGGLGIFIVKNFMDEIIYERKDSKNILVLKKKIN